MATETIFETRAENEAVFLMHLLKYHVALAEIYGKSIPTAYTAFRDTLLGLQRNGLLENVERKAAQIIRSYEFGSRDKTNEHKKYV